MPQEFQTTTPKSTSQPQKQAEKSKQQAKQATQDLRDQAGRAAETAREEITAAAQSARAATADAARHAQEGAQSFLTRQKDMAASEISNLGEAVQRAADKLHEEEDHNIASYAEAAATRARSAAEYLQGHEISDLFADVQTIARRHPAAVCGGMFAAGVAVARFLKASPPPPAARHSQRDIESWQGTRPPSVTTT